MNKQLSPEQLLEVSTKFPTLTRTEKLLRWAKVVRDHKDRLYLFHLLERMCEAELKTAAHPQTAFALAAADPVLADAGMPNSGTAYDAMKFFELSQTELHEFSCNCGGAITNTDMADRIERLAR